MDSLNIGERIKIIRKERKMTQKELADKIGMAEITIRQYENNKREPNSNTIKKIAKTLNIAPPLLFWDRFKTEAELISVFQMAEKENVNFNNQNYDFFLAYLCAEDDELGELIIDGVLVTEKELLRRFRKLNDIGKKEAIVRTGELTHIPKYQYISDTIPFE